VNEKVCEDPKLVKAEDFFFSGLNKPGNTANKLRSNVAQVNVAQIPGLNTLGISLVRIDYAVLGETRHEIRVTSRADHKYDTNNKQ